MRNILIIVVAVVLVVALAVFVKLQVKKSAPWEASGELVLVTHAVAGALGDKEQTLGLSIDDVELIEEGGELIRTTVRTRRIRFSENDPRVHRLLSTSLHVGTYSGLRFTLKSPELGNAWEGDEAPPHIQLPAEVVSMSAPFEVREGETTVLLLGFETQQNMHELDGQLYYLPVIHLEARTGAFVRETATEDVVVVSGGTISTSKLFGMDWDGTTYFNYRPKAGGVTKAARIPALPGAEGESVEPEELVEVVATSTAEEAATSTKATSTATTTPSDP